MKKNRNVKSYVRNIYEEELNTNRMREKMNNHNSKLPPIFFTKGLTKKH